MILPENREWKHTNDHKELFRVKYFVLDFQQTMEPLIETGFSLIPQTQRFPTSLQQRIAQWLLCLLVRSVFRFWNSPAIGSVFQASYFVYFAWINLFCKQMSPINLDYENILISEYERGGKRQTLMRQKGKRSSNFA